MSFVHASVGPRRRHVNVLVALGLALAALVAAPVAVPEPSSADAASSPLAIVVVGPVGAQTASHIREARRVAAQLRSLGARVREIYSPNATWSRVATQARNANLFVYLGQGRGTPGPYGALNVRTMDGLGLNRAAASGHRNVRHYGEFNVRGGLHLAPGAVVILNRVPYAAGSPEPGRAGPTRAVALRRADNYAAGFLEAGAAAVFASDRSVSSIVGDLFDGARTMESVFWRSPWTSSAYDSTFASSRTPGAKGILAPYGPGRYQQSVVGRLGWTAADWRGSWGSVSIASSSVQVTSVPALLDALANNAVTEIVVADGTYRVSPASSQASNSLWIGARFAGRTKPVTVRAETTGGVTFDGGGATYFGCLTFVEGARHQTWDGFVCANGTPTQTGAITFGGPAGLAAPHHITLRNITIPRSITSASSGANDHGIYFSQAAGGPHDLLIEGLTVDGAGGLDSALHFYHSDATNQNAWNVTVRRMTVSGTSQAVILWDPTLRNIVIEDSTITDAESVAVRYESPGASGIVFANVISTGSGSGKGFASSLGPSPPGVTFINSSFH